ncbi:MAG TPA: FtsH protease activity modulator HflK [Spongiibacteraceae bacterium]|nr:FtsH protease activity modulator HflK [Spongiibacteraceae bacterium]
MAWNEPGGNKPKDPWGGGDQGPPDLDEALKKFQEKIHSLFGGGKGSSGGSRGDIGGIAMLGAILAVVIYAYFALYQLDEQERAVVLRLGKYHETVKPGLHWNWPLIDRVMKVNVTKLQSASHRSVMLTQDENIVEISMSVQYLIADPKNYLLKVKQPEGSLEDAMESSLRHVVGGTQMDSIITYGREQVANDVQQRLQQYLDSYATGIQVAKVNIEDAHAPSQVQDAFDDVQRAKEDRDRLKNEAETYANGVVPEARGRAQRQIEEANAYRDQVVARAEGEAARFDKLLVEYKKAPEVTRQRLYIDAIQDVLGSNSKVLIDAQGSNNVMYLPLDKLLNQQNGDSGRAVTTGSADVQLEQLPPLRRDSTSSRGREGR